MPIMPLPQFEADLEEYQRELEAHKAGPVETKTLVVRFGRMKLIGEYPFDSSVKPGCGSKVVVRTHRGTELAEVLTSTCPNAGCGKSVSRKQIRDYIENSGGKDYPFFQKGRVLRIATGDDFDAQSARVQACHELVRRAREIVRELGLSMKIVEAEWLLGQERVVYYFLAEDRVDTRELHQGLGQLSSCRVELRQVGARDEARLIADYERCGQYCCCKNFLKVLKPISMRSAKTQKATLEPLKISGRCGRLMCCLRYEDETYEELRKRLPHRKSRVGTPHGDGIVINSQILTQLVLVALDSNERVAVPVEELTEPEHAKAPKPSEHSAVGSSSRRSGRTGERNPRKSGAPSERSGRSGRSRSGDRARQDQNADPASAHGTPAEADAHAQQGQAAPGGSGSVPGTGKKKRRRRRKRKGAGQEGIAPNAASSTTPKDGGESGGESGGGSGGRDSPHAEASGASAGAGTGNGSGSRTEGGPRSDSGAPDNAGDASGAARTGKKRRRKRRRRKPGSGSDTGTGSGGGNQGPSGNKPQNP